MSDFDLNKIPANVLHEAVYATLGSEGLQTVNGGYKFRCPICGDSKRNKSKKRGYVMYKENKWLYVCHNGCGTMGFLKFLKEFHSEIYKNIIFLGFKNKRHESVVISQAEKTYKANNIYEFKKGELLDIYDEHPMAKRALEYCKQRKIRKDVYSKWFVCIQDNKFFNRDENGNLLFNDKGYPLGNEYRNRLIIPYYRFGGKWVQFDARALDDNFLRYRNLEAAERELYNIDWLDINKPFFLLEGSINSTFIRNSTSFGGTKHLKKFIDLYPEMQKNANKGTVIWDNDNAGYDEMGYTINLGFNWFNWSSITPLKKYMFKKDGTQMVIKDINDLVLYTDCVNIDDEGFITYESLKPYIENPDCGRIKTTLLYGNREKMKKKKFREFFNKCNSAR